MKQLIILLALIYFVSCSSACANVQNPEKKDDCLKTETGNYDSKCCFLHEETNNIKVCFEIPNNVDIAQYISEKAPAYKPYKVYCKSEHNFGNILKSLILLVSLVLL